MESYLSKKGFVIKKNTISSQELSLLKKDLVAKPLVENNFNFNSNNDVNYPVFIETKNKIYIPKMYGISKYGFPKTILDNYNGLEWSNNITFNGNLLERQIEPTNILIDACNNKGGGILTLGTGFGKTICALYVLSKLKGKSIIVVNKIPLMNQWKSEISKFLPNAKVGTIQGQNIDIENCDIVIAMLQSMARIDYPDYIFQDFRTFVLDEAHNVSSKVFSKILFKLSCKYTLGLSATPKRSDGCEYVFKWHIGEIVYKSIEKRKGKPPIIKLLKIDTKDYKEISINNKFTGQKQIQFTSMLSELVDMPKRNLLIINIIKDIIAKDSNRKLLILSDRRIHLNNLVKLLENDPTQFTYGLFVGCMKEKDLLKSRASQVIFATYAAFGEGVSEEALDTLLLISPKKFIGHLKNTTKNESGKLNQITGRIFRKDHVDRNPIIIDFQDNFSVYKTQANSRKVFYKQHFQNAIFEDQSINLDDHDNVDVSFIKTKKSKNKTIEELPLEQSILEHCIIED